ncbi:MAG: peptidylprolyl isomerase, partial [Alistipes sp.]|nr:peptidylprolyl isomerase [Alistipes sp.]
MFRKGILLAAFVLLGMGAQAQKRQVMLDKVVAVVGGSSILWSEVEEYADRLTQQRRQEGYTSDRDPRSEALEALMTQKLLYNQAQIDSVKINDAAILSAVEEQVQQLIQTEGSILKLEAKHHMPVFSIREIMRQRYEEQEYANEMQRTVMNKVTIIPGEVERYYKSLSRDSLPTIAEQYVYAQITKFPKSMTEAKQRTRERLLDMRERVITGNAKFENLARMYSVDPGTMMRGGEMPPSRLAELDSSFGAALEKMRPGQISEVVESQYGFHIIQLIDKQGDYYHFRHILLKPTYTIEEQTASLDQLDSLVRQIRSDSITFERAALEHSDDKGSKMNGGVVSNSDLMNLYNASNPKLTVTKFLREDFGHFRSLDDYNALMKLKPGEISPAFLTEDMLGNKMAKVVKLIEIIPTHRASLEEDYLRLEDMAVAAKQERIFREWLTKKIDGMYVY